MADNETNSDEADRAGAKKVLHEFESTYFERLKLAAQVILDAVPDLQMVTDPLEVELRIFKERVEFLLLLPELSLHLIPWRQLLDGEEGRRDEGQGGDDEA